MLHHSDALNDVYNQYMYFYTLITKLLTYISLFWVYKMFKNIHSIIVFVFVLVWLVTLLNHSSSVRYVLLSFYYTIWLKLWRWFPVT